MKIAGAKQRPEIEPNLHGIQIRTLEDVLGPEQHEAYWDDVYERAVNGDTQAMVEIMNDGEI